VRGKTIHTQSSVARVLKGVEQAGVNARVEFKPDGTVIVNMTAGEVPAAPVKNEWDRKGVRGTRLRSNDP
jgi:peptidoglycan/xylan/chitin deacetylase (PgdA/CDA1 family)